MAEPLAIGAPQSAMNMAARYVQALERDQKLRLCCRHVEDENHSAQWFSTTGSEKNPDLLIITCGKCKAKHRRFFAQGSKKIIREVR